MKEMRIERKVLITLLLLVVFAEIACIAVPVAPAKLVIPTPTSQSTLTPIEYVLPTPNEAQALNSATFGSTDLLAIIHSQEDYSFRVVYVEDTNEQGVPQATEETAAPTTSTGPEQNPVVANRNKKVAAIFIGRENYPQIPCGVTRAELFKIAYSEYKKLHDNQGPLKDVSLGEAFALLITESYGNSQYKPGCQLMANGTDANIPYEIAFCAMQIYVDVHKDLTKKYPDPENPQDTCKYGDSDCIKQWLLKRPENCYRSGYGILAEMIGIYKSVPKGVAGYKGFANQGLDANPNFQKNYTERLAIIQKFGGAIDQETGCFISINEEEYLKSPAFLTPKDCRE
jgi:hypothetical protein